MDHIRATAIEVERRGRFEYVVIERVPSGLDGAWEPPHWFRWRAERHARKLAAHRIRPAPEVVLSLPIED